MCSSAASSPSTKSSRAQCRACGRLAAAFGPVVSGPCVCSLPGTARLESCVRVNGASAGLLARPCPVPSVPLHAIFGPCSESWSVLALFWNSPWLVHGDGRLTGTTPAWGAARLTDDASLPSASRLPMRQPGLLTLLSPEVTCPWGQPTAPSPPVESAALAGITLPPPRARLGPAGPPRAPLCPWLDTPVFAQDRGRDGR